MRARPRLPKNIQELVHWYERYISPLALVAGFVADSLFLLRRVDLWSSNLLLLSYLVVAGTGIVIINMLETGRMRSSRLIRIAPIVPVVVQFAFGGLFSGYLSLYSRSAAYAVSWLFVLLLAALLIGNERFTRWYSRLSFQISLYFGVLFSFLIFFLPVVLKEIGPVVFIESGVIALILISLFIVFLAFLVPERVRASQIKIVRSLGAIFLGFNLLYFTNAIPPLPLSLREAGVYHRIVRGDDGYHLLSEPREWYQAFLNYNTHLHLSPGEPAYVYSSIFAPEDLSTTIVHRWQRYDFAWRRWITDQTISFPIRGGRDGGYRGYSFNSSITPGSWRVSVLTEYGQVIARVSFTVEEVPESPALEELVR